jgi:hypothetical protein
MALYGIIWHVAFYGILALDDITRHYMALYGIIWQYMALYGIIWQYMALYGMWHSMEFLH